MIAIAAITSINGSIIVGARSNYALGRDWPLLAYLGQWDATTGTPRNAMLVQGAIALSLVVLGAILKGGFEGLVLYSAPVFLGFFLLTGVSLFVPAGERAPGATGRSACPGIRSCLRSSC